MSQALSLKCNVCGIQLRSVAEAQSHGEATGHADFAESTEAVLTLKCKECGKPCRSETEKDIHTKRTGHAEFVDKTTETAQAMDTEGEMKTLKTEMKEEMKAMKAELGLGGASTSGEDEEQVEPILPEDMLKELADMGFSKNKAVRALYNTGCDTIENAVNWCMDHADDMDVDEPLLVPKSKAEKKKLTPEEAKRKAEEMVRAAKARREAEERKADIEREKNRVKAGKAIAEAKRIEEDQARKRFLMEKEREKKEEAAARLKIKQKLEEDKRARRIKLGLPPDPTPEELEELKRKEAAKAAAEAEKNAAIEANKPKTKPVVLAEKLRAVLVEMKKAEPEERFQTCCKTLMTYCGNVIKDPSQEKFRKIRLGNEAFQKRVGGVTGGVKFLELLGFVKDGPGDFLELPQAEVRAASLNQAGAEINAALTNPFFGML